MKRERIVELDKRLLWHPYTQMRRYIDEVDPVVVARAEGIYLHDADGTRFVDGQGAYRLLPPVRRQTCQVLLSDRGGPLAHRVLVLDDEDVLLAVHGGQQLAADHVQKFLQFLVEQYYSLVHFYKNVFYVPDGSIPCSLSHPSLNVLSNLLLNVP